MSAHCAKCTGETASGQPGAGWARSAFPAIVTAMDEPPVTLADEKFSFSRDGDRLTVRYSARLTVDPDLIRELAEDA